jgi:phage terminase Nu1 subunit (DNA packaging protein)
VDVTPEATAPGGVNSAVLAALFDCDVRQIELLAKKGIVVRVSRGRYNAGTSTKNYIRHLREQAAGRVGKEDGVDGVAANVGYKQASTELLRLRIQREGGELVHVQDVRQGWERIVRAVRSFVLSIPGAVAFEVPTLSDHDKKAVERICRQGLEDVSLERGYSVNSGSEDDVSDRQAG